MKVILFGIIVILAYHQLVCNEINIKYTYWSSLIAKSNNIDVIVPSGSNFYNVMEKAAEENNVFEFNSTLHPKYGHFITSIGGHNQDENKNIYWMLYILSQEPDQSNPPAKDLLSPVGVDSLIVNEDNNYLFWLKHVPTEKH